MAPSIGSQDKSVRPRPSASGRRSRVALTLAAALTGGSLMSACETRFRDAFVSSSKDLFFATFLDPAALAAALGLDATTTTEE